MALAEPPRTDGPQVVVILMTVSCVSSPRRAVGPDTTTPPGLGRNRLSGRRAKSVSQHPPAQGGRRLDLVAGVEEGLEQSDRGLVPDHGLPRRRLGGVALEDAGADVPAALARRGGWRAPPSLSTEARTDDDAD